MSDYKPPHEFAQAGTTYNSPQPLPTVQVSAPPPSFNNSMSQTPAGVGYQYAPNGIQPNPGAFQPNQPQFAGYPQQAPQGMGMGLVQDQKVQFVSAAPLGVLGSGAAVVDCPKCTVRGVTRTSYVAGNTTHLWALGLCLCVLMPCIPYLIDSTKDVNHHCSNCGVQLATWHRSGNVQVLA